MSKLGVEYRCFAYICRLLYVSMAMLGGDGFRKKLKVKGRIY